MENVNRNKDKVGSIVEDEQYLKDRSNEFQNIEHWASVLFRHLCDQTTKGVLEIVDEGLSFLGRRSLFWEQTANSKKQQSWMAGWHWSE